MTAKSGETGVHEPIVCRNFLHCHTTLLSFSVQPPHRAGRQLLRPHWQLAGLLSLSPSVSQLLPAAPRHRSSNELSRARWSRDVKVPAPLYLYVWRLTRLSGGLHSLVVAAGSSRSEQSHALQADRGPWRAGRREPSAVEGGRERSRRYHDWETDVAVVFRGAGLMRSRMLHPSSGSRQGEGRSSSPTEPGVKESAGRNTRAQLAPAVLAQVGVFHQTSRLEGFTQCPARLKRLL